MEVFLWKKFKKFLVGLMAVASLAVGMPGMSASADNGINDTIYLYKDQGAPGSDTHVSQTWNFTTALSTMTMGVSNFTKTDNNSYVYLYASVNSENVISRSVYNSDGSASAYGVDAGEAAYASAKFVNLSGNLRAHVYITG